MKQHWVRLQVRFEAPNAIASGDLKWQYITIIATFSSSIFFRQLPSELPKRNSTIIGYVLGSECELKMHVRNLEYPLPLQIGGRNPTYF